MIELEITWQRVLRVWWSYLWRNILVMIVSMICGAIVGGIIGFILGSFGVSVTVIKIVCAPIGFVIGLVLSVIPMWLILGKDFGEFRLVLAAKNPTPTETAAPEVPI